MRTSTDSGNRAARPCRRLAAPARLCWPLQTGTISTSPSGDRSHISSKAMRASDLFEDLLYFAVEYLLIRIDGSVNAIGLN
jgi:hypothetical protein